MMPATLSKSPITANLNLGMALCAGVIADLGKTREADKGQSLQQNLLICPHQTPTNS